MRMILKSVMAGALFPLAAMSLSGGANAAPLCGTTTLNNWLGSGFSCMVGDKTFSNFSYNPDGLNVPATSVGVGPAFTPNPGIGFNAAWLNTSTGPLDAFLSFTVAAPAPTIVDAELLIGGIVGAGGQDSETFCTDTSCAVPVGTPLVVTTGMPQNSEVFATPHMSLFVTDDLTVFPGSATNPSEISILDKQFSQVPEPASLAIFGAALAGLGILRRRKST